MRVGNKCSGEQHAASFLVQRKSERAYSGTRILDIVHRSRRYGAQRTIGQNNEVLGNATVPIVPMKPSIIDDDPELLHLA